MIERRTGQEEMQSDRSDRVRNIRREIDRRFFLPRYDAARKLPIGPDDASSCSGEAVRVRFY